MIYCREDCKRCRYIKDAWYFYCDAKAMNLSLEVGESGYCPACGIRLRPGGETEEMVSKRVALAAVRDARDEDCNRRCPDFLTGEEPCPECYLFYAEQQAAGGRPE